MPKVFKQVVGMAVCNKGRDDVIKHVRTVEPTGKSLSFGYVVMIYTST